MTRWQTDHAIASPARKAIPRVKKLTQALANIIQTNFAGFQVTRGGNWQPGAISRFAISVAMGGWSVP